MLALVLIIAALVFGILSIAGVPGRVSWSGVGVICLAAAHLIGHFGPAV